MSPTATQDYISDSRRLRQSMRRGDILVVDDDLAMIEFFGNLCKVLGEKCVKFRNKENAKWCIVANHSAIKLAVLDYMLGDDTADELIELCRELHVPCVIHTGRLDIIEKLNRQYPDIITILKCSPIERLIKELV